MPAPYGQLQDARRRLATTKDPEGLLAFISERSGESADWEPEATTFDLAWAIERDRRGAAGEERLPYFG